METDNNKNLFHMETRLEDVSFKATGDFSSGGSLVKKAQTNVKSFEDDVLFLSIKASSSFEPKGPFVLEAEFTSIFLARGRDPEDKIDGEELRELAQYALREHSLLLATLTRLSTGTPYITLPKTTTE